MVAISVVLQIRNIQGGLELWDKREDGRRAKQRSPLSWGHTGSARLDALKVPLHCLSSWGTGVELGLSLPQ